MTKKHFTAVAAILKNSNLNDDDCAVLADQLATVFRKLNPLFDRAKFLHACDRQPPVKEATMNTSYSEKKHHSFSSFKTVPLWGLFRFADSEGGPFAKIGDRQYVYYDRVKYGIKKSDKRDLSSITAPTIEEKTP